MAHRVGPPRPSAGYIYRYGKSALDQGLITEADMDARLEKLFRVRMRLSHFDPVGPLDMIPADVICSDGAKATARDAVAQSVTLVKNEGKLLPYSAKATKTVAVIGPNAKQGWQIDSYYGPSTSCDGTLRPLLGRLLRRLLRRFWSGRG